MLVPQSGEERMAFSITPSSSDFSAQNVSFQDKNVAYHYEVESSMDPTRMVADMNDADLGSFFERPIKIASYNWGVGTSLFENFNPWQLYFENPRVLNRLTNFNLMRAKLNLKVMINGNGFFYGRAIASYTPLHISDNVTENRALIPQDVIGASQRPHIYIDPTYSTGGSMTLPFLWQKNVLNIPRQEWRQMGEMNLRSINNLKHANGANESVTISIFAWASEVDLSIPTSTDPGSLSPQAGDEYGQGPVSKPASVIARMAGTLTRAPVIGNFARATELAASTVADVARIFGYSRPNVIEPSMPTVIRPVGTLANTNVDDTANKLSLDVKQELSIDPQIFGTSSHDEMEIKSIAMRESYLCSFTWDVTDGPESLLWNSVVTPSLYDTNGTEYHFTPACHVALPFEFWRGSMEFRFQIVASNFHKGRIAVAFDPYFFETYEYNTQYTHIVDIASDKDFTIKCGWGNEHGFLRVRDPENNSFPWSATALTSPNSDFNNGFVSVRVLNELTSPNSTIDNSVQVNVFVKMCDDFEVRAPNDFYYKRYSLFKNGPATLEAQAGDDEANAEDTPEPSIPVSNQVAAEMASCLDSSDMNSLVYFGEEVPSIRSLMKRYCLYGVHAPVGTGASYSVMTKKDFPLYRGYAPNAVHQDDNAAKLNYFQNTIVNWFTPNYVAVRGGMRWKYHRVQSYNDNQLLGAQRFPSDSANVYSLASAIGPTSDSLNGLNSYQLTQYPTLFNGAAETNTIVDPCVEIECPFYSFDRFTFARNVAPNTNKGWGAHQVYTTWQAVVGTGDDLPTLQSDLVRELVSVGEDFTLSFFLSVPVYHYVPNLRGPL
jgi:hypothetical protein